MVEACSLFFWRGEGEDTTLSFSTTLCKTIKLLELEKRNGTKQKNKGKRKGLEEVKNAHLDNSICCNTIPKF